MVLPVNIAEEPLDLANLACIAYSIIVLLRTAKRHNRVRPDGVRADSIAGAKGFQGLQVSREGTGNPGIVDHSSQTTI